MENITLEDIKQKLKKIKPMLKQRYGVTNIMIFGSRVRGEASKSSDVDILVDFVKPLKLFEVIRLEDMLSKYLGIKVDLIPKRYLRKELRKEVASEAVQL